jgi:lysozyme
MLGGMPTLGIDVSHYQGLIDWQSVARSNVRFAFVKATEGDDGVDRRFAINWEELGETTLLRGAYHFARPNGHPLKQAEHFAATVGPLGPRTLPPVLDIETDGGLNPEDVVAWVRAFVSKTESLFQRELIIYTGRLWRENLGDPLVPELGTRMLWTARYGDREPIVPRTWSRWDFWQFTDGESGDVQTIPGIRGHCDCDRFRGDEQELAALAALPPAT